MWTITTNHFLKGLISRFYYLRIFSVLLVILKLFCMYFVDVFVFDFGQESTLWFIAYSACLLRALHLRGNCVKTMIILVRPILDEIYIF